MFFIRLLGPVIGLMLGSVFNKFYYTFDPPRGLSPRDPLWIGAWWAGFLLLGLILFGPSLGLFCFKEPPRSAEDEDEDEVVGDPEAKRELLDVAPADRMPKK